MADFQALRLEFPVTERLNYLDIANKNVPPRCVADAVRGFFEDAWRDGGASSYAPGAVEAVREAVARLLGARAEEIAFIKNTSEGLNAVVHALPLSAGDNVVSTEMEHPNAVHALRSREADGIELRWVPRSPGRSLVDEIARRIDARTRAVLVSHVTWATGDRIDVPALAEICRPRHVLLVVDGIQAVGVLTVDVERLGIDVLVAGAHKGLLGLNGTGVLYCRRAVVGELTPVYRARAAMSAPGDPFGPSSLAPDARRFELGNPNYLGLRALGRAVQFLAEIGVARIEDRVRELTTHLLHRLEEGGHRVRTPRRWTERAGIVAFEAGDAAATAARLRAEGIVVSARGGAIRASPHFYNTEQELDELVSMLRHGGEAR